MATSQRASGSRRRRVLHVAHNAAPHIGGLETVVAAETAQLARRGWEVTLVSSANGAPPGRAVEAGVRTVRLRAASLLERRFGVPFPIFTPWLAVVLAREVRRADVVHIHDTLYLSSWVAALWCRVLRTPYVVHRHVGFVHHPSRVVSVVQRLVLATAGRVVLRGARFALAIDEFVADDVRSDIGDPRRLRVLPNGVDTSLFRPGTSSERAAARKEFGLPEREALLLFVGRLVPKKGFPVVAAATSTAYRIVFAGGDRPAGADSSLIFVGALPADRLARLYRAVDACVVASVGECPLTVLEGLSSGLPVLLNDDPALRSSPWTEGPGVVFVDMASGRLRTAAEELFSDRATTASTGAAARRAVETRFSWTRHVNEVEALYLEALGGGGFRTS